MVNVLIVDDELKARNLLQHYLTNLVPETGEVQQADSVDRALEILRSYQPDILFLDVEMPHKNGFKLLTEVKEPRFDVIFTTAYNQYAIQAIRFSALDYLMKPVDPDELQEAVKRHLEKREEIFEKKALFDNLVTNIGTKEVRDFKLAVHSSEGIFFFTIDEILRLEAEGSYTRIHMVKGRPFLSSKTLKHFEEMLEEFQFVRTHRSHLVNARYIKQISSDKEYIIMKNETKVEMSRRKKEDVVRQLKQR